MRGGHSKFLLCFVFLPFLSAEAAERSVSGGNPDAQPVPWVGNVTDCSGRIATGGQAQTLVPANDRRRRLVVKNQSPETLVVTPNGADNPEATLRIPPRATRELGGGGFLENGYLVSGPRTGSAYSCEEG